MATADSAERSEVPSLDFSGVNSGDFEEEPTDSRGTIWNVPPVELDSTLWIDGDAPWGSADTMEQTGQTGKNTANAQDFLQGFYGWDDEQVIEVQQLLWLNGYYGDASFEDAVTGGRDERTYKALTGAVEVSIRSGRSLYDVLHDIAPTEENFMRRLGGGRGGGGRQPRTNVIQHMAEQDLRQAALDGFQAALGYGPTPEQVDAFMAVFRQRETAAQPSTEGGGTFNVTDPGNPGLVAKETAEQQQPGDAQSYKRLQVFEVMLQALGAGGR